MCTTNIYTTVYPDGRKETSRVPSLCAHARHGIPCPKNVIFQHPPSYLSNAGKPSSAPTGSPFMPTTAGGHFPPSPAYTPRSGTPNNYHSGNESDRSGGYRSGSSSRSNKSPTVYINGQRVYELDPYASPSPSSSRRRHKERVVLSSGPPSPLTPTGAFTTTTPHIVDAAPDGHRRRRASQSHARTNPVVIENPRPIPGIEVVDPRDYRHSHSSSSRHHSRHARHGSASSSHESPSRRSHDEEEAREARRRRRERKQQEYEQAERVYAQRSSKWNDRIAAANAHIASRPAVVPHTANSSAPRRSSGAAYRDADLADAVHGLHISGDDRRRHSRSQEAEDEAMKQRLKDRMMPRRATVSGRPRTQVIYDDGTVRWE